MAELSARVVGAGIDLSVDDDTAADSGAEGNGHSVPRSLGRAREELAEGGRVGVVLDLYLLMEAFLHHIGDLPVGEEEVGRGLDDARLGIDRAGHADTDILDVVRGDPGFFDSLKDYRRHRVANLRLGTGNGRFASRLRYYIILLINDSGHDVCAAEIDSYSEHTLPPQKLFCMIYIFASQRIVYIFCHYNQYITGKQKKKVFSAIWM